MTLSGLLTVLMHKITKIIKPEIKLKGVDLMGQVSPNSGVSSP